MASDCTPSLPPCLLSAGDECVFALGILCGECRDSGADFECWMSVVIVQHAWGHTTTYLCQGRIPGLCHVSLNRRRVVPCALAVGRHGLSIQLFQFCIVLLPMPFGSLGNHQTSGTLNVFF